MKLRLRTRQIVATFLVAFCIFLSLMIGNNKGIYFFHRIIGRLCSSVIRSAGGGFVKIGQLLGTRSDIFPSLFCNHLSVLQDKVTHDSLKECLRSVPNHVIRNLEQNYCMTSAILIGSGSVSQVFSILHKSTSNRHAMKIVRQPTRRLILEDIKMSINLIRWVSKFSIFRGWPLYEASIRYLRLTCMQCNMRREARLQTRAREKYNFCDGLIIPEVIEVPHDKIMIMELIDSICKLDIGFGKQSDKIDRALFWIFDMLFNDGLMHCDLHPGNLLTTSSGDIVY